MQHFKIIEKLVPVSPLVRIIKSYAYTNEVYVDLKKLQKELRRRRKVANRPREKKSGIIPAHRYLVAATVGWGRILFSKSCREDVTNCCCLIYQAIVSGQVKIGKNIIRRLRYDGKTHCSDCQYFLALPDSLQQWGCTDVFPGGHNYDGKYVIRSHHFTLIAYAISGYLGTAVVCKSYLDRERYAIAFGAACAKNEALVKRILEGVDRKKMVSDFDHEYSEWAPPIFFNYIAY